MQGLAQRADVRPGNFGAAQQLLGGERRLFGPVFLFNTVAAARVAQVLPQQFSRMRVQQANMVAANMAAT